MSEDFSDLKAIYFDLDDTLCGYWNAAKGGLKHTFSSVTLPDGVTPEGLMEAWVAEFRDFAEEIKRDHWYEIYLSQGGITRMELMRLALARLGIDDARLAFELGDVYGKERRSTLALFPSARELLNALRGQVTLGVITNGPADIQREELQDLGIEDCFDHVFIEGEMGEGKPAPRVMQRAVDAAGCEPNQIMMVGNSFKHDIVPAREAGWRTCWIRRDSDVPVTSRTGRVEELPDGAVAPDLTITHLDELYEILTSAGVIGTVPARKVN
ncbi:MAG: HAD family hydrolase [Fimbriimonadaceae bacterium]|nr:HAD family hydrolase [Fimbriimonadaceae bacterium]